MTDFDLNPDSPHSPERTAEAGQWFDDLSRLLVYASMPCKGGLEYPADAYRFVADVYSATGRIPQMCEQLEAFLRAQVVAGQLYEARGRDIEIQRDRAAIHLGQAAAHARALTRALQEVQADISGLGVRED